MPFLCRTKVLLFVFFLFVLVIFLSVYGLCSLTDRKYFPHLGKGNSPWRKFKESPLGSDLTAHSVISYSWTEASDLFLASNSSVAINTTLFNPHLAVDIYTSNRGCLLLSWNGNGWPKKKKVFTKLQNGLFFVVCDQPRWHWYSETQQGKWGAYLNMSCLWFWSHRITEC